jgi:hypothetical protein
VAEQLEALRSEHERDRIAIAIFDPLYLSLLAGVNGPKAEHLYDTGPLLMFIHARPSSLSEKGHSMEKAFGPLVTTLERSSPFAIGWSAIADCPRTPWLTSTAAIRDWTDGMTLVH